MFSSGPFCRLTLSHLWNDEIIEGITMTRRIRIRAVERKDIDLDKLAFALLRLARQLVATESETPKPAKPSEARDE